MNRSDVFISYRRVDKEFTVKLDQALKAEGLEVWVDWEDIPPGAPDFNDQIKIGIEGADVFVPVLSASFPQSMYCMGELQMAIDNNKRIIPIVLEKFDRSALPDEIRAINWVYFTPHTGDENKFEDAFPILMEAIRADQAYMAEHTRYLLRAKEWVTGNKRRGTLLHGTEVIEAERWLAEASGKEPPPLALHTEYIFASRAWQRRLQRRLLAGVTAAAVLSIALAVVAVYFFFQSLEAAQAARSSAELARESEIQAQSLLWATYSTNAVNNNDARLGITLALAANQISGVPPAFSQQALAGAAYAPGPRNVFNVAGSGNYWTMTMNADEQLIVAGSSTGGITIWEVGNDVQPLRRIERAHEGSVWDVAFHPVENRVISVGADGKLMIWDIDTGELVQQLDGHGGASLWSVAIGPNGRYVAAGSVDGNVYVWELPGGNLTRTLLSDNRHVWAVQFSPQGTYLAGGGSDGNVRLWEGRTFEFVRDLNRHAQDVWAIDFNPDETDMITASSDQNIIRWEVGSGAILQTYTGHRDRVLSVDFSDDGEFFLSGSADAEIFFWEVGSRQVRQRFSGHQDMVWAVELADRTPQFVSASADQSVILWDMEPGAQVRTINGRYGSITSAVLSPDGRFVVIGTEEGQIVRMSATGGEPLEFQPRLHSAPINDLAYSTDGRFVASAGDTRVIVWDAQFPSPRAQLTDHDGEVQAVTFDETDSYIYSAGSDNKMLEYEIDTFELYESMEGLHAGAIWDLAVNPVTGDTASASSDRSISIWDMATGEGYAPPEQQGHTNIIRAVAYSPNGRYLVSGGNDALVVLYDLEDNVAIPLARHTARVNSVAFNQAGTQIVSADEAGIILVWDTQGNLLRRLDGHQGAVTHVQFNPANDNEIMSASMDGTVIFWRADSLTDLITWTTDNRESRLLTDQECEFYQISEALEAEYCQPDDLGGELTAPITTDTTTTELDTVETAP